MSGVPVASAGTSADRAATVEELALALWTWEAAGLEPGETAVYAVGAHSGHCLGLVARWRSLREVIRLDFGCAAGPAPAGVAVRRVAEPQEAVDWLGGKLSGAPGVAAAILVPDALAADVLLESLPVWGRLVLAMSRSDPATVDFYMNVHRKGLRIVSVPGSVEELREPRWARDAALHFERAGRILASTRLAAECLA